jgi:hypothetical protein
MQGPPTRRRFLAAAAATSVAGCLTAEDANDGATPTNPTGTASPDEREGSTEGDGPGSTQSGTDDAETSGDLDLREANVVGVSVESAGDGTRFSVTLIHDDDGEDGYANWWTVETRDGTELGRRELLHAHGTQEFTRAETISMPGDLECVVVRGHDQTHGYGGQAAVVSVASGATRFERQGSAPASFADAACP